MYGTGPFQRLVHLSGDNDTDTGTQDARLWRDTGRNTRMVASAVVLKKTNCNLYLETATSENGPWTATSIAATGTTHFIVDVSGYYR